VAAHTAGHIAYAFEDDGVLFPGDTLFALGCGRLFEGTAAQMHTALARLMALPPETRVYCAHEYTQSNARFAVTVEPQNAALMARVAEIDRLRADGVPTVPFTLADEAATNPFVRAGSVEELALRRAAKDGFRG
jgi:hydroxyacylglutathione hydrolase